MWVRALLVMAPLVAVLGAAPVQASGAAAPKITPGDGAVVTSPSVLVSVKTAAGGGTLYVDSKRVGSGKSATLTYRIDGRREPNGTHTVRVDAVIPWDTANSTFRMAVPALRPSGLSVSTSGSKVTVQWSKGPEPDLTGYTVSGDLGTKNVSIGACGARCSVTFASSSTASGRATVSVVARRSGAEPSGAASKTVKVSAQPQNGNGSGNGNGTGNGNAPAPAIPGFTYEPPSSNTQYPEVAPDDSVFSDEKPAVSEVYPTPDTAASDDMILLDDGGTAAGTMASESLQWGKSLAIALVLLLCAAHLGTWTRRLRTARAGGPGSGPRVMPGSAHARVEANRQSIEAALAAARGEDPEKGQASRGRPKDPEPEQDTTILATEGEIVEELNLEYTPAVFPADPDAWAPAAEDDSSSRDEAPADPVAAPSPASGDEDSSVPSEPRQYDEALNALIGLAAAREPDSAPDSSSANLTEVLEHPRPRRRGLRLRRR
ncbi:hypothetical protein EDD29_8688 [Actinocorallia herbida]|uniref:Fibronectin type-III domain-containing protein n=1 Tax=Actinocorallia herbida TaxID=58109 RepID=A0A3N1DBU9_9ACTN|nr:Ig-like domain-containing protein [Actinocorallia herbida]ROO90946.1 hypothetical protein EDD29_8688 [Actinocorallia herbida]